MPARALERFDDDPGDFIGERLQNFLDHRQTLIGELLVFGIGSGIIDEREGDLEVARDEPMKIAGDDRIVRELRDIERENGPAMERLIEMNKPARPRVPSRPV